MKVAIVHDWLGTYGGAERVIEIFHEIFPKAPIYTLIYNEKTMPERFKNYDIRTTFIQKMPFGKTKYQSYLPLMPRAFEELDLREYDLVLSSATACAKGVITRPDALHICYCNTPMRYAWEFYHEYKADLNPIKRFIIAFFMYRIRMWDRLAADRVDYFISDSDNVKNRISKYYRRDAVTIYPPVNIHLGRVSEKIDDYYLIVSRLVPYKRIDIAVEAFNRLGYKLLIIGDGSERKRLERLARDNICFLGKKSDSEIMEYYQHGKAFVFPGEEDFGITPVEAQMNGMPVIAFGRGGATETVSDGRSGILFNEQTTDSLVNAVSRFETQGVKNNRFDNQREVERFSVKRFKSEIENFISKMLEQNKNGNKWE